MKAQQITIRRFTATLHQLFNIAFKSIENNADIISQPAEAIQQWLQYCVKMQPVILDYHSRPKQVHFQAFTLDPAFKPTVSNSLAIIINYSVDGQKNNLGMITLLAVLDQPAEQIKDRKGKIKAPYRPVPTFAEYWPALLGGGVRQQRLLIDRKITDSEVFYQAKVMPELVFENSATVNTYDLYEPLAVYLARLIVSGVGLDYRTQPQEALFRGFNQCDYIQHLLICHISQPETSKLAFFSDEMLCTLKWQELPDYNERK